eukprot:15480790-Alexandrium_andersonii.AAC.2
MGCASEAEAPNPPKARTSPFQGLESKEAGTPPAFWPSRVERRSHRAKHSEARLGTPPQESRRSHRAQGGASDAQIRNPRMPKPGTRSVRPTGIAAPSLHRSLIPAAPVLRPTGDASP